MNLHTNNNVDNIAQPDQNADVHHQTAEAVDADVISAYANRHQISTRSRGSE